ncbi:MAG: hypothetical protein R2749_12840 [Acidimicrobiales bacterium]
MGDDPAGRQLVAALRAEGGGRRATARPHRLGGGGVDPDGERSFYTDRGAAPTLALGCPAGRCAAPPRRTFPPTASDGEPLAGLTRRTLARSPARPGCRSIDASSVAALERPGVGARRARRRRCSSTPTKRRSGLHQPRAGLVVYKAAGPR